MTWLLPKRRYTTPVITQGMGQLSWDSKDWIVTADSGTNLKFTTKAR